jgi:hypothetical protein
MSHNGPISRMVSESELGAFVLLTCSFHDLGEAA